MALNAYLRLKGQKQGDFKGGVIQKGREGFILVNAWSQQLISPRDPASGMATGKRQHGVLRITKPTDISTPQFYQAWIANESLGVELMCYEPNKLGTAGGSGVEALFFTVQLTNARVVEMTTVMPNNLIPATQSLPQYEDIAFSYETITWTYKLGNKMASDTWQ